MFTAAVLRALALLGVVAASVSLFFQSLRGTWLPGFVKDNAISYPERLKLIATMGGWAVVVVLCGVLLAWRWGAASLKRAARLAAPLAIAGVLPTFFHPEVWTPLNAAIAIGCVALLSERLLALSFQAFDEMRVARSEDHASSLAEMNDVEATASWVGRHGPMGFVLAGALAYAIYMSVETLWMHGRFETYGYDLGQYDNIFWSTLHGHPLRDSPLGSTSDWSGLSGHADLSTFFFLPFYAIHPGGPALLVIQSCALGLGAIPLYRFSARHIPRVPAALLAVAYLFYPPMHGLQFYDFHMQPMASTFLLCVIDFVDAKRYWLCAAAFVVAIGCREDVSIGLAILGGFLLLSGYRPVPGAVMAIVGSIYFVLIRMVIMPHFGPTWFHDIYKDLLPEGAHSFAGVITTLASNPAYVFTTLLTSEKLTYILQILAPLAFLPLRRAYLLVALVHGSLLTLLTTRYAPTTSITFQYSANFIPYVFAASALALEAVGKSNEGKSRQNAALGALLLGTTLCCGFWGAIPPRANFRGGFSTMTMRRPTLEEREKHQHLQELHALVPPDASLAVSEPEMPHLSRLNMRTLRDTTDADYLLYSTTTNGASKANGEKALATGEFATFGERPGLMLLKRRDLDDPENLASKAPWKASSTWGGAFPEHGIGQRWPSFGRVFFHTKEDASPWIEFDFGSEKTISHVEVVNRQDCCRERAAPLVLELSHDGATWIEIARTVDAFSSWKPDIEAQRARYLRLRVSRQTWLHLERVDVR